MLKRLLTIFLILSTLSYSSVWSLGGHDDEAGEHEQKVFQANDSHPNDVKHDLDADHCCHAAAHLIGLLYDCSPDLLNISAGAASAYRFSHFSYQTSPPYRPPLS